MLGINYSCNGIYCPVHILSLLLVFVVLVLIKFCYLKMAQIKRLVAWQVTRSATYCQTDTLLPFTVRLCLDTVSLGKLTW